MSSRFTTRGYVAAFVHAVRLFIRHRGSIAGAVADLEAERDRDRAAARAGLPADAYRRAMDAERESDRTAAHRRADPRG